MRMCRCIIHPCKQHILKGDLSPGGADVVFTGSEQFLQGILTIDRHRLPTQFVRGCVQGDGKVDLQRLLAEPTNGRDKPHGRDGHVACPQVEPLWTVQDTQRLQNVFVVMQRFTHAHQDDIRHMIDWFAARETSRRPWCGPQLASEVEHLGHDLPCAQMTVKTHLSRCAEGATKGAAYLCRDTDGGTCTTLTAGG